MCACERADHAESAPAVITVFAAASTTDAITDLARSFESQRDVRVRCSFAASSSLARQIIAGAPADVFLSANLEWMNKLEQTGLIDGTSRLDLLGNRLVLVAPEEQQPEEDIDPGGALADIVPEVKRIALADPAHVPAGIYAKQAMKWYSWWQDAEPLLLPTADVRSALRLVELGEADLGFVYASDAAATDRVAVLHVLPTGSHEPIRYPVARCQSSSPLAASFIEFLQSPEAAAVFEAHGFDPIAVASVTP